MLAAATFGFVSLAAAQGPEGPRPPRAGGPGFGPGGPGGPPIGMMARRLGLTDDQKDQLKALHERERESTKPLLQAAREARQAFNAALKAEGADAATVGQAALAMREARVKLEAHHKAAMEGVKAILTTEQFEKLEQMRRRGSRRGPGPAGEAGPDGQRQRRRGPGRSN